MNTRLSSARDMRAFLSLRFRGPVVINRVAGGGDKEREEGSSRAYANEHRMLSRAGKRLVACTLAEIVGRDSANLHF